MENSITVPQGQIASLDIVKQIAFRLQKTYQPPKKRSNQSEEEYQKQVIQPDDFPIVVELAMAQGHNPLSKTFHYWKQDGKIAVDDHYAPYLNWAQSKNPFTYTTEELSDEEKATLEGVEKGDWVVRFKGIRRADQPHRQQYFKTILDTAIAGGVEFEKALEIADRKADERFCVQANGVVKFEELHYKSGNQWIFNQYATPKGWIPGLTRAEVRAIRNGIKKMMGVPTPEERRRLGMELDMREVAQLAANVPIEIVEQGVAPEYMQLEANTSNGIKRHQEEIADMTPEEIKELREKRIELLRGKKDDTPIGEESEEALVQEELPFTDPLEITDGEIVDMEAIALEYESREVSFEVAREAVLNSYKSEVALGKVLKSLFGIENLIELSEKGPIWLWNFYQYTLRRDILLNVNIPIEQRLKAIPEIADPANPTPPKTLTDAKPFLHNTLKVLCENNKKMRRLNESVIA